MSGLMCFSCHGIIITIIIIIIIIIWVNGTIKWLLIVCRLFTEDRSKLLVLSNLNQAVEKLRKPQLKRLAESVGTFN